MHGGTCDCHTCEVSLCFKVTTWQIKEPTGLNYYKGTGGNYHTHDKCVVLAESMVMEKQEDNIEEKKMRKEEMENDNVVMCHSQQKKQRENTEEIEKIKEKKMRKAEMENNHVVMCCPLQLKQKENTEEISTTSSLHHTC